MTVALTFRDSPARGADVSAGQRALLEPLSYNGAFAPDCSGNYNCECWCPIFFISSSERMTGPDAVATPSEPKTVAELRVELDEYLFGADRRSRLARRAALRGDTDGSYVNPGYRENVWNNAKKKAEKIPGVGPADLCNEAYSAVLLAFDRGTKPTKTMGHFFSFYLRNRTHDLFSGGRVRDRDAAAELTYLESLGDPRLEDEIERLRSIAYVTEKSFDDPDSYLDPVLMSDAIDLGAGERAESLNRYRLCIEACAHGMKDLSAVLTWDTLDTNPDVNLDDVPKQMTGPHVSEWQRWPALWFSCQDANLFKGDARRRRRRSNDLQKVSELRSRALHLLRTAGVEL